MIYWIDCYRFWYPWFQQDNQVPIVSQCTYKGKNRHDNRHKTITEKSTNRFIGYSSVSNTREFCYRLPTFPTKQSTKKTNKNKNFVPRLSLQTSLEGHCEITGLLWCTSKDLVSHPFVCIKDTNRILLVKRKKKNLDSTLLPYYS